MVRRSNRSYGLLRRFGNVSPSVFEAVKGNIKRQGVGLIRNGNDCELAQLALFHETDFLFGKAETGNTSAAVTPVKLIAPRTI